MINKSISDMIISGSRNDDFWSMIRNTLQKSNLKQKYIDQLLNHDDTKQMYDQVFTHRSANEKNNYEWLEILGDATVNKSVVWYISKRFPQLRCTEGVKIIARLKINLISKKTFADFASKLDWWSFISADEEIKQTKKKKLLEDVFESFFAATELLIDNIIYSGSGFAICYRIVAALFNELDISLAYHDLYDPITILKETGDYFKDIGTFIYENEKKDGLQHVNVVQLYKNHKTIIGFGIASLLDDAKQKASKVALQNLKSRGISKPIPEYYRQFENKK